MFTLVSQMKNEVERELSEKKENECSDYEGMLQKLEAEVRQHIRVNEESFLCFNNDVYIYRSNSNSSYILNLHRVNLMKLKKTKKNLTQKPCKRKLRFVF